MLDPVLRFDDAVRAAQDMMSRNTGVFAFGQMKSRIRTLVESIQAGDLK